MKLLRRFGSRLMLLLYAWTTRYHYSNMSIIAVDLDTTRTSNIGTGEESHRLCPLFIVSTRPRQFRTRTALPSFYTNFDVRKKYDDIIEPGARGSRSSERGDFLFGYVMVNWLYTYIFDSKVMEINVYYILIYINLSFIIVNW